MKPVRTWVLIANGARARLLLNDGPGHGIKALKGMSFSIKALSAPELTSDRPGRITDSSGPGRHALEAKHDPVDIRREQFLKEVVDKIEDRFSNGEFDRLIVVASPKVMGEVRHFLPDEIGKIVTGEIAKDLTHIENDDLVKHLGEVMAL